MTRSRKMSLKSLETIEDFPTRYAVKVVRLKVHTTIASPMTSTLIQGHKRVSNVTTF